MQDQAPAETTTDEVIVETQSGDTIAVPKADEAAEAVNEFAARIFGPDSWAAQPILGNPVAVWIAAAALAVLVYLALSVVRRIARSRVKQWSERTSNRWDDLVAALIDRIRGFFLLAAAIFAGSLLLALPPQFDQALRVVLVIAFAIQAAMLAAVVVEFALERLLVRGKADANADATREALKTSVGVLKFIALLVVYAVIALVALDNMGVNVTAMVASLGIGGIAVALAVQNILGDLFGSLTIVLDKPFEVGDFIIVGDKMGTVEKVGLKTTRIRALSGEQLVFANSDLLSSRVQNFKRMQERRATFTIGVTYDTDYAQLEALPKIIQSIIEAESDVRHDRTHFARFKDSWLEFESVYYVNKPDMTLYMDVQQRINLKIVKAFRERGIEFAFPTQTMVHQGLPQWAEPKTQAAAQPGRQAATDAHDDGARGYASGSPGTRAQPARPDS